MLPLFKKGFEGVAAAANFSNYTSKFDFDQRFVTETATGITTEFSKMRFKMLLI